MGGSSARSGQARATFVDGGAASPGLAWCECSILFELMEKTFKHYLPNFNECWWDSWVLDVAICNALGIVTGELSAENSMEVLFLMAHDQVWVGL